MRAHRNALAGVAVVAVASLVASCAATSDEDNNNAGGGGSTVTVIEVNGFTSYNGNTADNNSDINGKIMHATHGDFWYIDRNAKIVPNEKFGKYEKLSDNPLKIKYTVNEDVKWSDGNAVDAADLLLSWATNSGWYDDATIGDDGKPKSGSTYFSTAADTTGLNATKFPEIGEDGRSITIEYTKPFSDWENSFSMLEMPAHVVAKSAELDEKGFIDLLKNEKKGDPKAPRKIEKLAKMASFWNTGFDNKGLPSDPSLFLSSGPYMVSAATPDQSITLKKNEKCTWAPTDPKIDEIVVRFNSSGPAMVQALRNSEADVIAPQASGDTLAQLKGIGDKVEAPIVDEFAYDHLDLVNDRGAFKDPTVRQAFMLTIPREDIVEKAIKPVNPDAKVLNSQIFLSNQEDYKDAVAANGSDKYNKVDIDGAKKLLAGKTPTVKILYNKENQKRLDSYTLIAESASKAGFKVVDGGMGKSEWSKALKTGGYDASIFGWINSGVGNTGIPQIYKTGSGSNFTKFSSPEADTMMEELLATVDPAKQKELKIKIDKAIWDGFYGLPLFQTAAIVGVNKRVKNVSAYPGQRGVFWNVWEWTL